LKKKLFLFDVDGVLFNTKHNMENSWKKVCSKFKINKRFSNYFNLVGLPFYEILKKLKIKKNIENIKKYYSEQSVMNNELIKIYPNVKSTIDELKNRGDIVGIVTSKDYKRTKILFKKFNLVFKIIECHSKKKRGKPYPDLINNAVKKANIDKKNVFYIGDTFFDFLTAKNAKIKFIFANYGYGSIPKIKKKYIINNISQILKF